MLNIPLDDPGILTPADIAHITLNDRENFNLNATHIYMIGRRPYIAFKKIEFNPQNLLFSGILLLRNKSENIEVEFENKPLPPKIQDIIKAIHPNKVEVGIVSEQSLGVWVGDDSFPYLLWAGTLFVEWKLQASIDNFEILYIGQAYGDKKEPTRITIDRLSNHEHLQPILAENIQFFPCVASTWILVFPIYTHQFDTSILNRKELVDICEASFINFYEPVHNNKYTHDFPYDERNQLLKCIEPLKRENIQKWRLEIDTSKIGLKTFNFKHPTPQLKTETIEFSW